MLRTAFTELVASTFQSANGRTIARGRAIHPEQAEVVRRIFREYAAGRSPREICKGLTADGITPPGARWSNASLVRSSSWAYTTLVGQTGMLRNELYHGVYVWNRPRHQKRPDTMRERHIWRPQEEWVRTEVPSLRIADEDTWAKVQTRLAANNLPDKHPKSHPGKGLHLLSGRVTCGVCGANMVHISGFYRCARRRNRGPELCSNSVGLSEKQVMEMLPDIMQQPLCTPQVITDITRTLRQHLDELKARMSGFDRPDSVRLTHRLSTLRRQ
jgi:hypothetical protein